MVRGHVQMGLWFLVVQMARMPQVCRQGSTHFLFTQALSGAHSALTTHSGLQLGGWLMNPAWQEHTAWLFMARQLLLGPQGDGLHGFNGGRGVTGTGLQLKNGSPVYPGGQSQVGTCLSTVQMA